MLNNKNKLWWMLTLLSIIGCGKENYGIPYVSVDKYIYVTDPLYNNLNTVGNWAYIDGGSRGLVVYRLSFEEFKAFDRHCTYLPENSCGQVEMESSNITLVDSCCMSRFQIIDGYPIEGEASYPLAEYVTTFDGSVLHIYN